MKRVATSLLLSLAAASVAVMPAIAQRPAPDGPRPLAEAVTFAPLGASTILFTDWAAAKAAHGHEDVTSATPLEERMDAMVDLGRTEAPFAGYAIDRFALHAEAWGWDTADLDWEASYVMDGPPVAVLRLRHDFDLAPVIARFDDRGFSTETYGDATIRSHGMDLSSDWIGTSDFGILNTAFVDDGRTLVLSSSLEAVRATLDARHIAFVQAPPSWVVAGVLGSPLSAAIEVGTGACAAYDPRLQGAGDAGANADLLVEVGPLTPWQAMGIGTDRDETGAAIGRYVFDHLSESDALANLAGRARLADQGISLRTDAPYAGSVFRLASFTTEGRDIVLDVAPVDDASRRLQQAFLGRDMIFATCG